jgi:hypothetical protein
MAGYSLAAVVTAALTLTEKQHVAMFLTIWFLVSHHPHHPSPLADLSLSLKR